MANQHTKSGSSRSHGSSEDNRRSVSASGRNSGSGSSSSRSQGSGSSNRGFAQNHDLAVEAGRKGGQNSHGGRGRSRDDE